MHNKTYYVYFVKSGIKLYWTLNRIHIFYVKRAIISSKMEIKIYEIFVPKLLHKVSIKCLQKFLKFYIPLFLKSFPRRISRHCVVRARYSACCHAFWFSVMLNLSVKSYVLKYFKFHRLSAKHETKRSVSYWWQYVVYQS
jgi:hypothetical protein